MEKEELETLLAQLSQDHRDLDDMIAALAQPQSADQLQLQRLKRKKLMLKDKIAKIADRLLPDIIA